MGRPHVICCPNPTSIGPQPGLLLRAKFHTLIKIAGSRMYVNFLKMASVGLKLFQSEQLSVLILHTHRPTELPSAQVNSI